MVKIPKSIFLKVDEAFQNDIGRGIARIDSAAKESLNLSTGDVIKLTGKKSALAIVWQTHPDDENLNLIRIDGILRQNAGVGIGDNVSIEKVEISDAKKIILAPSEKISFSPGFELYVKKRLIGKPLLKGNFVPVGVFGRAIPLLIIQTFPQGPVMITDNTEFMIKEEPAKEITQIPTITYDDIGGLKDILQKVREMVELPLRHPELFEKLGIEPPKGVLLYGPPGTGKTLLAKAVANESDANFFYIGGPEIVSKFVGESEEKLRKMFKDAEENSPSIIFIDEIDAIAPKRGEVTGEVEKRVVSQLLTIMDGLKARGNVIVIAATNRPDSIDPALRRPGRFDREIEIGVPSRQGREEILKIHTRGMPLSEDVDIKKIASITHGYTGADLSSLVKEAAMKSIRKIIPKINMDKKAIPPEILESIKVEKDDFMDATREIAPSALREVFIERPNISWNEIGGLEKVKSQVKEAVELPLKNPEIFEKMGIRPLKGILLYGPPGTGKTLIAKAVANESEANFIGISGTQVLSKWVGESEKIIRELFRKAKISAPCILFIDEIDAIAPKRGGNLNEGHNVMERVVDTFLTEMDGLSSLKNVVVIGATNRPDILDEALIRAGRFDRIIEIPLPNESERLSIFKIHVSKMPLDSKVSIKELAKKTNNFSGADLENLCREAAMFAIRENSKKIKREHFENALKITIIKGNESKQGVERFKLSSSSMYG